MAFSVFRQQVESTIISDLYGLAVCIRTLGHPVGEGHIRVESVVVRAEIRMEWSLLQCGWEAAPY